MNDGLLIRPIEATEIESLSALASRTYADAFGASMSAADLDAQLLTTRSAAYFRKVLATDTILVAEIGRALVGYVQISDVRIPVDGATEADQELFALYVDSDYQSKGIGTALLKMALTHERVRGARNIYLDVWEQNGRAIALYRQHGFEPAGWRDFVVDGRVVGKDLVMVRQAAPHAKATRSL